MSKKELRDKMKMLSKKRVYFVLSLFVLSLVCMGFVSALYAPYNNSELIKFGGSVSGTLNNF